MISPSVTVAIVVRIVSNLADDDNGNDDGADGDDDDDDDDNDDVASTATVVGGCDMDSLLNAPSIESALSLVRVSDNDGNDASATCSALSSICIVFETTNSFIVPL